MGLHVTLRHGNTWSSGKGALEQALREKDIRVQAIENKCYDGHNFTYLYIQGYMPPIGFELDKNFHAMVCHKTWLKPKCSQFRVNCCSNRVFYVYR